ncbi:MAG: hypothetical protein JSU01_10190 [Bacteroidetes bacterium]|nr:hypothetical protein [Bacteroidota bacterium]
MKPTFLIILLVGSFTATAQVKKDTSTGVIYPKSFRLRDTEQLNDYSNLFKDKPKVIDSNYIKIYHSKNNVDFPPAYYVDSVRAKSMSYIDPKDITDIKIFSGIDSVNKTKGKIYVTLKKHSYHLITIEELTKRAIPNFDSKTEPIIYFVDDKLVTDTTGLKFEITHIRDVEVIDGSQIKAFKGLLSNIIVLKINTGNAPIYIRGNTTPASFKQ